MSCKLYDTGGLVSQTAIGNTRPKHRVSFGHIVPPEEEQVCLLNIGIAVCRLVNAESLIEANHRGCHTQTRIGINVIGAETALHELARRVGFGDGVLTRAND